jgi:hypothetical protein
MAAKDNDHQKRRRKQAQSHHGGGTDPTGCRSWRRRQPAKDTVVPQRKTTMTPLAKNSTAAAAVHDENGPDEAAEVRKLHDEEANRGRRVKKMHDVRRARSREREEQTLTLICGSVYHVMNSTCIHLRVKGLNIYMYRRGRIYKEPPEEIQ